MPTTPPASAVNIKFGYGNKKDVGETSAAYPSHQAFALPLYRDKQLSQPTPLGIIYNVCAGLLACKHTGIIHPARTLRCGIFL